MPHVGYHYCPDCGASYAATHFASCAYAGIDPRDIVSPLSYNQDEHIIALQHQCRAYGINAGGPYYILKGSTINSFDVHRGTRTGVIA